jgi:aspartyl-tRNA(Asn)/glutamyl-tRNA(Gln) amidotransferase subunit A
MPSTPTTAPGPETTGDARFNSPWSYCGLPAVTIPSGVDDHGLPVGLQIVGPHHGEGELLAAAAWCEARLGLVDNIPPGSCA